MNNLKVSIVVPIYNAEKYLKRCLDSLINQTEKNIEIVLVNDGSTDESTQICLNYVSKYVNIKYIEQDNQGVSIARNNGIINSSGEYIMFCDSDDYYELDTIEKMYSKINQGEVDLVISGVRKNILGNIEYVSCGNQEAVTKEDLSNILYKMSKNYMLNQIWGKLFKRKIIIDNSLFFKNNLCIGEDMEWMCSFSMHISSIVSIEDITYNYIIYNQESLSQKFYNNYFTQLEIIFSRLYDLFLQYEINLRDFELMYINDVWCGIKAINKSTCSLSLLEKIYYVKQGLSDIRFKKYMSLHKEEIGRLKYFLFSLPSLILTLILLIRSKCNDYIKNKK